MRRWGWVAAVMVAGMVVFLGCSPTSDTNGKPPDDWGRENEDDLMNFFAQAYEDKDEIDYGDALDVSFLFQFTPEIAESLELPEDQPWWGKTDDVGSTTNMFEESEVTTIKMDYEIVVSWYPCNDSGKTEFGVDTTFSGLCGRLKPDIQVTIEKPGQEPKTLWVNDSWLDVMVVPDRFNDGLWTILRIEEMDIPN